MFRLQDNEQPIRVGVNVSGRVRVPNTCSCLISEDAMLSVSKSTTAGVRLLKWVV